jgi:hypothetical protein
MLACRFPHAILPTRPPNSQLPTPNSPPWAGEQAVAFVVAAATAGELPTLSDGSTPTPEEIAIALKQLVAWLEAPEELRKRFVRELQHAPALPETSVALTRGWAADLALEMLIPQLLLRDSCAAANTSSLQGLGRQELTDVLMAWALNSHEFTEDRSARRRRAAAHTTSAVSPAQLAQTASHLPAHTTAQPVAGHWRTHALRRPPDATPPTPRPAYLAQPASTLPHRHSTHTTHASSP